MLNSQPAFLIHSKKQQHFRLGAHFSNVPTQFLLFAKQANPIPTLEHEAGAPIQVYTSLPLTCFPNEAQHTQTHSLEVKVSNLPPTSLPYVA
jgi:hypothetical protein